MLLIGMQRRRQQMGSVSVGAGVEGGWCGGSRKEKPPPYLASPVWFQHLASSLGGK